MIDKALDFLTSEINTYLTMKMGVNPSNASWIVLSNVAKEDGTWAIPNDTLGLSLINIEEERVMKEQQTVFRNMNGDVEHYNPEIKLNLYVLISARFISNDGNMGGSNNFQYIEGLKQLSSVISFFQGKNVFTTDNSPALDSAIQKLIVELYSYSFEQQYNFWTVVGAKYLPSVLYRVRLLTFQEKRIQDQQIPIDSLDIELFNS
jgi:hypothetical protein